MGSPLPRPDARRRALAAAALRHLAFLRRPQARLSTPQPAPDKQPAITVFGGSRVQADSEEYAAARRLGRALAERGFVVVNGGFEGVMAAVSQGAREGGGRAIGVTVELLAQTRSANPWIDQEVRTAALLERIDKLIELGDGYAVLPGGAGTLLELGAVWNLSLLGALHGKPIVVVGHGWQRVLETMVDNLHALPADLEYLTLAPDAEAAATLLFERLAGRAGL